MLRRERTWFGSLSSALLIACASAEPVEPEPSGPSAGSAAPATVEPVEPEPSAPSASGAGLTLETSLANEASLEVFARLALTEQASERGGGVPETPLWEEHEAWYGATGRAAGIPTRLCRWHLFEGIVEPMDPAEAAELVAAVRCEDDRCVVWFTGDGFEPAAAGQLPTAHLYFDEEGQLWAAVAGAPGDPGELPPAVPRPDPPRCPMHAALERDSVGEDFWTVQGGLDDDGYRLTRHCGEAAESAANAIGDRWSCASETYCGSLAMCGNYCESVSGALRGDAAILVAHFSGMEGGGGRPVSEALLERLRASTPCAGSVTVDDL